MCCWPANDPFPSADHRCICICSLPSWSVHLRISVGWLIPLTCHVRSLPCAPPLVQLGDAVKQHGGSKARIKECADELLARAAALREGAGATKEWEEAVTAEAECDRKSVGSVVGALLKKKGLKAAEVVARWGGTDGLVDKGDASL